jgi:phosphinothricin acetyltransferase
MRLVVRSATEADLPVRTDLYHHYVRETPVTFDVDPESVEERLAWLRGFGERGCYRLLVAERQDAVVGYACRHRFRPKAAYDSSVETTVYLAPEAVGLEIGTRLYAALFEALAGEDLNRALAGITLPNPASVALQRRFGFAPVGVLQEVGRKLGRCWDVQWFEKPLPGKGEDT